MTVVSLVLIFKVINPKIKDASAGTYPVVAVIPESTWVNLRYEFDGTTSGSAVRLYFNGELTIETTLTGTVTGIKGLERLVEKNFSSGTVSFDNTYFGDQTPSTGGDSETPSTGDGDTGSANTPSVDTSADYLGKGEYVNNENTITYTGATAESLGAEGYSQLNIGADHAITFEDGAMHYTANGTTGKYSTINFENIADSTATTLVFETDIMFSNAVFTDMRFVASSNVASTPALWNNQLLIAPNSGGGYDVKIKDAAADAWVVAATLPESKWVNFRYEMDGKATGDAVRLYINGTLVKETTLPGDVKTMVAVALFDSGKNFSSGTISLDNTYLGPQKTEE